MVIASKAATSGLYSSLDGHLGSGSLGNVLWQEPQDDPGVKAIFTPTRCNTPG